MFDFGSSSLLRQRSDGERTLTVPFMLAVVLLIVFASSLGQSMLVSPVLMIVRGGEIVDQIAAAVASGDSARIESELQMIVFEETAKLAESSVGMVAQLLSTAVTAALTFVFCICMERRSVLTMGISLHRAPMHYGFGLLVGAAMLALTYLVCRTVGAISFLGVGARPSPTMLVLFFFGYLIQGASEEILMRGFLMLSLARRYSVRLAVFSSSVFFALMHIGNAGITLVGLVNVFLFGTFAALLTLRTGSLLGACAVHTAWNFTQGCVFGCSVSGFASTESIFKTEVLASGLRTSGGVFGLEGGLAASLVLLLALLAVCLIPSRKRKSGESFSA